MEVLGCWAVPKTLIKNSNKIAAYGNSLFCGSFYDIVNISTM
jgi:hypothetical protein